MTTIYLDTETGGVEPKHPTIQLAAIATDGDLELGSFSQRIIFDEAACDPDALKMNHYDRALWTETAVKPGVCASKFEAWLRPYRSVVLVSKRTGRSYNVARMAGYNTAFDQPRLIALFAGGFVPCEYLWRDVLQRVLFCADEHGDGPENFKLTTVAAWLGIETDGAHDALFDVRLCHKVYRKLCELEAKR